MKKEEVQKYFFSFFPQFRQYWESKNNYFIEEDGNFNYHQLCASFYNYFRDEINTFSEQQFKNLFGQVEAWVASDTGEFDSLGNAVCTEFLENIDKVELSRKIKPFLGEKSLEFYSYWDPEEKKKD